MILRRPPHDGRSFLSRAVQSLRESNSSLWAHHNGVTKRLSCHTSQEVCPFPTRFAEPARELGKVPVRVQALGPGDGSAEAFPDSPVGHGRPWLRRGAARSKRGLREGRGSSETPAQRPGMGHHSM